MTTASTENPNQEGQALIIPTVRLQDGEVVKHGNCGVPDDVYPPDLAALCEHNRRQGNDRLHLLALDGWNEESAQSIESIRPYNMMLLVSGMADANACERVNTHAPNMLIVDAAILRDAAIDFCDGAALLLELEGRVTETPQMVEDLKLVAKFESAGVVLRETELGGPSVREMLRLVEQLHEPFLVVAHIDRTDAQAIQVIHSMHGLDVTTLLDGEIVEWMQRVNRSQLVVETYP
jgi:hypothetical protein